MQGPPGGQGKVNFDKVNEAEKREGSGLRQGGGLVVWWSGGLVDLDLN